MMQTLKEVAILDEELKKVTIFDEKLKKGPNGQGPVLRIDVEELKEEESIKVQWRLMGNPKEAKLIIRSEEKAQ